MTFVGHLGQCMRVLFCHCGLDWWVWNQGLELCPRWLSTCRWSGSCPYGAPTRIVFGRTNKRIATDGFPCIYNLTQTHWLIELHAFKNKVSDICPCPIRWRNPNTFAVVRLFNSNPMINRVARIKITECPSEWCYVGMVNMLGLSEWWPWSICRNCAKNGYGMFSIFIQIFHYNFSPSSNISKWFIWLYN